MITVEMLLCRNAAFAALPNADIEALADAFRVAEYPDGHVFIREGERNDDVYMVVEGQVAVIAKTGAEMNRMPPGSLFGLMAIVDGGPRSATCRAMGTCRVARLSRDARALVFDQAAPIALVFQRAVAKQLARDFRHLDELLREKLGDTGRARLKKS